MDVYYKESTISGVEYVTKQDMENECIHREKEIQKLKEEVNFDGFKNLKSANENIKKENDSLFSKNVILKEQLKRERECVDEAIFNIERMLESDEVIIHSNAQDFLLRVKLTQQQRK